MAALQGFPWRPLGIKQRDVVRVEGQQRRQLSDVFCFRGVSTSPLVAHGPQPLMLIPPGDARRRCYRREQVPQRAGIRGDGRQPQMQCFRQRQQRFNLLVCAAVT